MLWLVIIIFYPIFFGCSCSSHTVLVVEWGICHPAPVMTLDICSHSLILTALHRPWKCCPRNDWWGRLGSRVSVCFKADGTHSGVYDWVYVWVYVCEVGGALSSANRMPHTSTFHMISSCTGLNRQTSSSWGKICPWRPPSAQRAAGARLPGDSHPQEAWSP